VINCRSSNFNNLVPILPGKHFTNIYKRIGEKNMWFDGRVKREVYDNVVRDLKTARNDIRILQAQLKQATSDNEYHKMEDDCRRKRISDLESKLKEKETIFFGNMMKKILRLIGE
jgi:hypothetical protein